MPPRARTTKTPAKRAPRKAAPRQAVDEEEPAVIEGDIVDASDAGPKVEADQPDGEPELVGAIVPFHGREIAVRLPTLEQLVVMRRLAGQYQGYGTGDKQLSSADEALTGYDRALKAITSVIVNPNDVAFVEDLLLENKTDLTGAGVLLKKAMDALSAANEDQINRAERRRAGKRPAGSKGTAKLATR